MKTVSLVGYRFNNLEQSKVLEMIEKYKNGISLEAEPTNPYDSNAIAMYC
jgi:hypothetical protein